MFQEFKQDTLHEDLKEKVTMLEFYSKTCGPCKMLAFILKDLDKTYGDQVKIIQIPFEENPDLVKEFHVEGYPTIILFRNGEEVSRKAGLQQKPVIAKMIEEAQ